MADAPLRALTVWQPWAWAIVDGWKPVENRSWAPPSWLIGQELLIHAGMALHREAVVALRVEGVPVPPDEELVRGAILGIVRVVGVIDGATQDGVTREQAGQIRSSLWWSGPIGWVLDEARPIDPIPCRGRQGLWVPDADVQERVREALHG